MDKAAKYESILDHIKEFMGDAEDLWVSTAVKQTAKNYEIEETEALQFLAEDMKKAEPEDQLEKLYEVAIAIKKPVSADWAHIDKETLSPKPGEKDKARYKLKAWEWEPIPAETPKQSAITLDARDGVLWMTRVSRAGEKTKFKLSASSGEAKELFEKIVARSQWADSLIKDGEFFSPSLYLTASGPMDDNSLLNTIQDTLAKEVLTATAGRFMGDIPPPKWVPRDLQFMWRSALDIVEEQGGVFNSDGEPNYPALIAVFHNLRKRYTPEVQPKSAEPTDLEAFKAPRWVKRLDFWQRAVKHVADKGSLFLLDGGKNYGQVVNQYKRYLGEHMNESQTANTKRAHHIDPGTQVKYIDQKPMDYDADDILYKYGPYVGQIGTIENWDERSGLYKVRMQDGKALGLRDLEVEPVKTADRKVKIQMPLRTRLDYGFREGARRNKA